MPTMPLPLLLAVQLLAPDHPLLTDKPLPQAPVRTALLHKAEPGGWQYSHHGSIVWHDGRFFAMWSNARKDEDSSSQIVRYATSRDGLKWNPPRVLAPDPDGEAGELRRLAGGFWQRDGELLAWAMTFGKTSYVDAGGQKETWKDLRVHLYRWTGKDWADTGERVDNFIANEGPRPLASGGYLYPGQDAMFGVVFLSGGVESRTAWKRASLPGPEGGGRLCEPTWYAGQGGQVHALLRDCAGSKRLFRASSADGGATWSRPVQTDVPDANAKLFAGRLQDGRYFLLHNPNPKTRIPLVLTLRPPGRQFAQSWVIRGEPTAARLPGMHKGPGYQYPHAVERDGMLYVIYSVNKEDVAVSVIDLRALPGAAK